MDPPQIQLVIVKGPREGETLAFRPGVKIRIGRVVRGNNVAIKDAGISTKHLEIESKSGKWILLDVGSSNGTILNSNSIAAETPFKLRDGDTVKLGEYTSIVIKIDDADLTRNEKKEEELESRRRNPSRRCRASKNQPENFVVPKCEIEGDKELEIVEGRGKVRATRSRKNDDSVSVAEKVLENPKNEVKKGRGRGRGRKRNVEEELCVKETNIGENDQIQVSKEDENVEEPTIEIQEVFRDKIGEKEREFLENDRIDAQKDEEHEKNLNCEIEENLREESDGKEENVEEKDVPVSEEQQNEGNSDVGQGSGVKSCATIENETSSDEVEVNLEKMTLGEWFDYMEIHLPKQIIEETDEMIEGMRKRAEKFHEYVMEQKKGKIAVA